MKLKKRRKKSGKGEALFKESHYGESKLGLFTKSARSRKRFALGAKGESTQVWLLMAPGKEILTIANTMRI